MVDRIIKEGEIGFLCESQREDLAYFAAVQLVRGPSHKKMATDMVAQMRGRLIECGIPEREFEEQMLPMDDDAAKRSLHRIVLTTDDLVPHFLGKAWILLEPAEDHPFWIADAPHHRAQPGGEELVGRERAARARPDEDGGESEATIYGNGHGKVGHGTL